MVGFPGSGKTTVFNAMTGLVVPVGYGGELRLGTVAVPDVRLERLAKLYRPRKTTFSEVTFCDVPGEHGRNAKSLSPRALQRLREQDALCLVLGDFEEAGPQHPDPVGDLTAFHEECLLADLEIAARRLERLRKERASVLEIRSFERTVEALEAELPLRTVDENEIQKGFLRGFGMLTGRPLVVILNVDEERAADPLPGDLAKELAGLSADGIVLSAQVEAEIAVLAPHERDEFLESLGVAEPALDRFIRMAHHALELISFFTVGGDEVRAWAVKKGTRAREAAGRVHSDMERGFIRAEITQWDALLEHGSEAQARKAGALRVEGKSHVVEDGDVMHVRFNV